VATIWSAGEEIVLEEGLQQDAAHLAGAEDGDAQMP
jgi:hypothetical protein